MKLTLGFSPCPNDTFIFDALVHSKIDAEGLSFEPVIGDVESLNKRALHAELDVTKISYPAYGQALGHYRLLRSGGALGSGCGPLLIKRKGFAFDPGSLKKYRVALPGKLTTAHFLLNYACPEISRKKFTIFSETEDLVLKGKADLGVIIHENRFTYEDKGLEKVLDLGEWWERKLGLPIPLGGIVVRRALPRDIQAAIGRIVKRSVYHAMAEPGQAMPYVAQLAQELEPSVIERHIGLYVNAYTLDLGSTGARAVTEMMKAISGTGLVPDPEELFVPS